MFNGRSVHEFTQELVGADGPNIYPATVKRDKYQELHEQVVSPDFHLEVSPTHLALENADEKRYPDCGAFFKKLAG